MAACTAERSSRDSSSRLDERTRVEWRLQCCRCPRVQPPSQDFFQLLHGRPPPGVPQISLKWLASQKPTAIPSPTQTFCRAKGAQKAEEEEAPSRTYGQPGYAGGEPYPITTTHCRAQRKVRVDVVDRQEGERAGGRAELLWNRWCPEGGNEQTEQEDKSSDPSILPPEATRTRQRHARRERARLNAHTLPNRVVHACT